MFTIKNIRKKIILKEKFDFFENRDLFSLLGEINKFIREFESLFFKRGVFLGKNKFFSIKFKFIKKKFKK